MPDDSGDSWGSVRVEYVIVSREFVASCRPTLSPVQFWREPPRIFQVVLKCSAPIHPKSRRFPVMSVPSRKACASTSWHAAAKVGVVVARSEDAAQVAAESRTRASCERESHGHQPSRLLSGRRRNEAGLKPGVDRANPRKIRGGRAAAGVVGHRLVPMSGATWALTGTDRRPLGSSDPAFRSTSENGFA